MPINKPEVLLLTSSLLTDRMILYSGFINFLSDVAASTIWATSLGTEELESIWNIAPVTVSGFPEVLPYKEFPYNLLRRLNELVWDFYLRPPSRMSTWKYFGDKRKPLIRALKLPARFVAALGGSKVLENLLENLLLDVSRCPEATERLSENPPDVVISTNPFWFTEPGVTAVAKKLNIPVLAMIPSWDNLSTKNRMVFKYDGYLVWSEQTRNELHHFYPYTRDCPVYVIGAPQFDVFFQDNYHLPRENFLEQQNLSPELPVIVYAIGSPKFIPGEVDGAIRMADYVARGKLGDVQMLVRPHPIHDYGELENQLSNFKPRVVLQNIGNNNLDVTARSQDHSQIVEWVNTFRHADVVVNLSSTVTIDAAIFDKPVVNLDFDPAPNQPQQALIKDINHLWTHFRPIAESGGLWLVNDFDELLTAVKTYLKQPELHREKRRWMAEYVCGYVDGRCGERMALAISDFVERLA